MRRLAPVLFIALLLTAVVAAPASAAFHEQITNPALHALVDIGIFAALAAPVVGLYWLTARRGRRTTARR